MCPLHWQEVSLPLATREVPVFQNVPEVPHEAVMETVLIRQNHESLWPPAD